MLVPAQELAVKPEMDLEEIKIRIKKKYLELFKEICKENSLDAEKELNARLETALVDSFSSYSSKCIHEERALKFLKGGKSCQRIPGFDFTQVEKLLSKMDTVEEQIEWLENYLQQLQKTRETIYFNSRGLPTVGNTEDQFASITPYMQVYPQAVQEIQKKIRELEAQKIVKVKVTHKM